MKKIKDLNLLSLKIDVYGELLTRTQLKHMQAYYFEDETLAEIGMRSNITRSAVQFSIKNALGELDKYEKTLKVIKNILLLKSAIKTNKLKVIEETFAKNFPSFHWDIKLEL